MTVAKTLGKARAPRVPVAALETRVVALETQVEIVLNELVILRQEVRDAAAAK